MARFRIRAPWRPRRLTYLCEACQDIFSSPRRLAYGTYYPWNQTAASFELALSAGCHLCNLIEQGRSYNHAKRYKFPESIKYAFKALNSDWARYGNGPKWLVPEDQNGGEDDEIKIRRYLLEVEKDPTPNNLGSLLATDSESIPKEMENSWIVLEFYGPNHQITLPMELANREYPAPL
jgi:hypothetical protein